MTDPSFWLPERPTESQWLTRKEAGDFVQLSEFWLEKHAHDGKGPRFSAYGRKIYYRKCDLIAWLEKTHADGNLQKVQAKSGARKATRPSPIELEIRRKRKYREAQTAAVIDKALAQATSAMQTLQSLRADLQNIAHA